MQMEGRINPGAAVLLTRALKGDTINVVGSYVEYRADSSTNPGATRAIPVKRNGGEA